MMYVKTLYVNSLKGFPDTSAGNNPPALIPQLVTIHLQCRKHQFDSWVRKIPWRRERLPTPVFLLGEPHRQRSLVDYSPWGHKELDTAE